MRGRGRLSSCRDPRTKSRPTSAVERSRQLEVRVRLDALQRGIGADELDERELRLSLFATFLSFVLVTTEAHGRRSAQ